MATRVILVDDLDGSDAAETVRYVLDGKGYEIDLSEQNAKRLRESLAEFIDRSRRPNIPAPQSRSSHASGPIGSPSRIAHEYRMRVRTWAVAQGTLTPAARGSISLSNYLAYSKAFPDDLPPIEWTGPTAERVHAAVIEAQAR